MTDNLDIDFTNKDSILQQLILIENELEDMKKKNGLQPDDEEMFKLFKKIITFCHYEMSFKIEEDLTKMVEFNRSALSIRILIFEARTADEYF